MEDRDVVMLAFFRSNGRDVVMQTQAIGMHMIVGHSSSFYLRSADALVREEGGSASTPLVRTPVSVHSLDDRPCDLNSRPRQPSLSFKEHISQMPSEVRSRPQSWLFVDKILFDPQFREHRQNNSPKVVIVSRLRRTYLSTVAD